MNAVRRPVGWSCYKMGGSFEIDKRDVLSIKNISARQAPVSAAGSSMSQHPGKSDSSVVAGEKADGALPAGKTPDAASPSNPSDSFAQKRLSLQNERESLLRERQEIQDAVKDSPDWMSEQQFNALTRRNAELDARIKKFNEEANRLSEQRKQQGLGIKKQ